MLINHFEKLRHMTFKGLLTEGSPRKITFYERNIFLRGFRCSLLFTPKASLGNLHPLSRPSGLPRGRIFQNIPPLGSVLTQGISQYIYVVSQGNPYHPSKNVHISTGTLFASAK